MIKLTSLTLIIAVAADHGTWDHPQQAELPSHDWLVVDHARGTSFGLGVCVAGNAVFTAGSMAYGERDGQDGRGHVLRSRSRLRLPLFPPYLLL